MDRAGLSFPTWKPKKRIDFILVKREKRAELAVEVRDVQLMGNTTLAPEKRDLHKEVSSDHLGVWALLALPPSSSSSPSRLLSSPSSSSSPSSAQPPQPRPVNDEL